MAISLDNLYSKMTSFVGNAESDLQTHMENMDVNNTQDQMKLQMLTQKWTMAINLSTNMMNVLKESTEKIIQNIR